MANYTINITGQKKIEAIKQARKAYDAAQQASWPPPPAAAYVPLADNAAYLQVIIDSAVVGWKQKYKQQIAEALAPTEAAAAAAAQAAFAAAVNAVDPS